MLCCVDVVMWLMCVDVRWWCGCVWMMMMMMMGWWCLMCFKVVCMLSCLMWRCIVCDVGVYVVMVWVVLMDVMMMMMVMGCDVCGEVVVGECMMWVCEGMLCVCVEVEWVCLCVGRMVWWVWRSLFWWCSCARRGGWIFCLRCVCVMWWMCDVGWCLVCCFLRFGWCCCIVRCCWEICCVTSGWFCFCRSSSSCRCVFRAGARGIGWLMLLLFVGSVWFVRYLFCEVICRCRCGWSCVWVRCCGKLLWFRASAIFYRACARRRIRWFRVKIWCFMMCMKKSVVCVNVIVRLGCWLKLCLVVECWCFSESVFESAWTLCRRAFWMIILTCDGLILIKLCWIYVFVM